MLHQSKTGQGGWERISRIPNPGVFLNNGMSEKHATYSTSVLIPRAFSKV